MKITIVGPAAAFDAQERLITDPVALSALDGVSYDGDVCSNYLDEPPLSDIGIIEGGLRIVFESEPPALKVVTVYRSPRALKPKELQSLVEFTRAQWSDGLGEGAFDRYADETGITIDVSPLEVHDQVTVEQIDDGVTTPRKRYSPLLKAAAAGDVAKIKKLVAKGEPLDAVDKYGYTPLHQAIYSGNADAVKLLLELGADVHAASRNEDRLPPLGLAARQCKLEAVLALLEAGAAVDSPDNDGMTPLMWAANRGSAEIVELFLDLGANPNAQTTQECNSGRTALMLLPTRSLDVARLLLDRGADPTLRELRGQTAAEFHAFERDYRLQRMPSIMTPERIAEYDLMIRLLGGA